MKRTVLIISLLAVAGIMVAQNVSERQPAQPTPEQVAQRYTDMLKARLELNEKQTQKVYKLYLKQARNRQSTMAESSSTARPSGAPQGGRPQGVGGPGAGMRPAGGMQGGGHRPPMKEQDGEQFRRERPRGNSPFVYEEPEENVASRKKKMKKILSESQYTQWESIEAERIQKEKKEQRRKEQERRFPPAEKKIQQAD